MHRRRRGSAPARDRGTQGVRVFARFVQEQRRPEQRLSHDRRSRGIVEPQLPSRSRHGLGKVEEVGRARARERGEGIHERFVHTHHRRAYGFKKLRRESFVIVRGGWGKAHRRRGLTHASREIGHCSHDSCLHTQNGLQPEDRGAREDADDRDALRKVLENRGSQLASNGIEHLRLHREQHRAGHRGARERLRELPNARADRARRPDSHSVEQGASLRERVRNNDLRGLQQTASDRSSDNGFAHVAAADNREASQVDHGVE